MNTKGTKFLAVLAVLAMAFAAFAVIAPADESDALVGDKWTAAQGPLNFSNKFEDASYTDNWDMKNTIQVSYQATDDGGVYTVTGTLAYYANKATDPLYKLGFDADTHYGVAFVAKYDGAVAYTIQVGTGAVSGDLTADEKCMLGVKQTGTASVVITGGDYAGTYTIDTSGVTLSEAAASNPTAGYVAIPGANALLMGTSGIDMNGGTWSYAAGVLTLSNYNGNEVFDDDELKQVTLSGENKIEATAAYAIKSELAAALTIKPVEGQGTLDIVLNNETAVKAIDHVNMLNIQATALSIAVPESGDLSCGIYGTYVNLYESTIDVSMDATTSNVGIFATNTLDIKSCASVSITANKGISAADLSIAASDVDVTSAVGGIVVTGELSAMKNTTIDADASIVLPDNYKPVYGIKATTVSVESDSTITADKMRFAAGTNNATINVAGDVVLSAGTGFTNKSEMAIGGDFLVMGTFDNQGTATVLGKTILMKADEFVNGAALAALEFTTTAGTGTAYYVMTVTINGYEIITSTSAYVRGVLGLSVDNATEVTKDVNFEGTATVDETGAISSIDIVVKTTATTGEHPGACIASVPITFVADANTAENNGYFIAAAGEVVPKDDTVQVLLTNSKKTGETVEKVAVVGVTSAPVFGVSAGEYTAIGGIVAYKEQAALVSGEGKLSGDLTVGEGAAIATTGGKLEGDVSTKSEFTLGGELTGDIATSQNVTIGASGKMDGMISVSGAATVAVNGTLNGNIEIADKAVNVDVTGKMVGDIVLKGKYKSSAGASTADTDYQVVIGLDTNKAADSTRFTTIAAAETTPGFITVGADFKAPSNDKTSSVTVKEGTMKLTASLTIPATVDLTVNSGATLEVASVATITITGAIKAEDGAIINIYDADAKIYSYGKLSNELTFYVAPYTYYCSFTYALANAPEGTELNITKDVTVIANASVKKDVKIYVGENRTITFNEDKILSMAEGASFVLSDGAKIVFTARTADTKVDSGVFEYGDNKLVLDAAYFKTANATITAVKETSAVPANISFVGTVAAGEVEFATGLFAGTVTFETLGAGTPESPYTSATATIDDGAVFTGTYVKDAQGKANFVIDGTWKVNASRAIDMALSGDGNIELADAVALTINNGYAAAAADRVAQTLNVTYGDNAVKMDKLVVGDANATYGGLNMVITAVKATSTAAAYMKIESATPATGFALFSGDVEVAGEVSLGKTFLDADAKIVVPTGATLTLIKDTTTVAVGLLSATGTFNFNLADDTTKTYGVLDSQISYTDGSATVYAALATAITKGGVTDFTVSSNIEMEGGTAAEPKDLGDVTLAVAEGKKLTITGYVTLGTAATTVGAAPGVTGNIVLADGAVLIVYDNATVDADSVYANAGMTVKAAMSEYIISFNDAVYATIFANHNGGDVTFAAVQGALSPSFDGYRFTGYEPYVAGATKIGDSDVAINLEAGKVSITLAAVEGVTYYINGAACKQTGAPVQVVVGSVVSAQANAGYTGTVKVNGQDYITVDPTTKTITASGASPITPEPEPAEGLGLTEILLIVLVILIAIMVVVLLIRLNRS